MLYQLPVQCFSYFMVASKNIFGPHLLWPIKIQFILTWEVGNSSLVLCWREEEKISAWCWWKVLPVVDMKLCWFDKFSLFHVLSKMLFWNPQKWKSYFPRWQSHEKTIQDLEIKLCHFFQLLEKQQQIVLPVQKTNKVSEKFNQWEHRFGNN